VELRRSKLDASVAKQEKFIDFNKTKIMIYNNTMKFFKDILGISSSPNFQMALRSGKRELRQLQRKKEGAVERNKFFTSKLKLTKKALIGIEKKLQSGVHNHGNCHLLAST